jgi:hypothetical protein
VADQQLVRAWLGDGKFQCAALFAQIVPAGTVEGPESIGCGQRSFAAAVVGEFG